MRKRQIKKYIKRYSEVQAFRLVTAQPRMKDINRALSNITKFSKKNIQDFDDFYKRLTMTVAHRPRAITKLSFIRLSILGIIADKLGLKVTSASYHAANRNHAID